MATRVTTEVLSTKLDSIIDKQREHTSRLISIEHTLNGREGQPGMITRLDRVEQLENGRKWHIRALWTGLGSAIAGILGSRM